MIEDINEFKEVTLPQPTVEQKSSVEVKKNSRGYNWSVKVYDDDVDKALEKMISIELECQDKYGKGGKEE